MSVPKKKISKTRTRSRRSHHALKTTTSIECPQCGAIIQSHRACLSCGMYRGKSVLKMKKSVEKKIESKEVTAPTTEEAS